MEGERALWRKHGWPSPWPAATSFTGLTEHAGLILDDFHPGSRNWASDHVPFVRCVWREGSPRTSVRPWWPGFPTKCRAAVHGSSWSMLPMAMFDDDELRARERRDMVRHLCVDLEQTVHANATTVVVIHGRHGPKAHQWRTQRLAHMARSLVEVTAGRDGRLRIRRGQAPWRLLHPLRSRHVSDHRQPTLAEWSPERLQVPTERCEQRPCRAVEATDVNVEGGSEAC